MSKIQSNLAISNSVNSKSPLFRTKIEFPWIYPYVFSYILSAGSISVISNSPLFRKFKVALNPMCRLFWNFTKSCMLSWLLKFYTNKKISPCRFRNKKELKLKLRVFLAGHRVAMVTYCVTKIIPTCLPVIGKFFDTMIVASIDKGC